MKTIPEIVQENHYTPWGNDIPDLAYYAGADTSNYRYNGKELQRETNYLDYGARQYDPQIGRWYVQDPLAEKYYSYSPYNYTLNNPINLIDPDGRAPKMIWPPIKWMSDKGKDGIIFRGSSNIGKNDNAIHVVAHGNKRGIRHVENNKKGAFIDTPKKFDEALSKVSEQWANRKENDDLTVILHACNTGNGFAQELSEAFPDVTFVAPNDQVYFNEKGELGTYETKEGGQQETKSEKDKKVGDKKNESTWQVFKEGKVVKEYDGDWSPKPDPGMIDNLLYKKRK